MGGWGLEGFCFFAFNITQFPEGAQRSGRRLPEGAQRSGRRLPEGVQRSGRRVFGQLAGTVRVLAQSRRDRTFSSMVTARGRVPAISRSRDSVVRERLSANAV
jgi:hypothetical protein